MSTYKKAGEDVLDCVRRMMVKYHQPLSSMGVTIDCLLAFPSEDGNGDGCGHAVTHGGYPCAATIKIIGLKDRVAGRADAELVIDGHEWDTLTDEQRDALIDHELQHLEPLGKTDDFGRPKLKCAKHDHQFGWFDAIVRRHGAAAPEMRQARQFFDETYAQQWLGFADDVEENGPAKADEPIQAGEALEGVSTVTLSSGDTSVTLAADSFSKIAEATKKVGKRKYPNTQEGFKQEVSDTFEEMGILAR